MENSKLEFKIPDTIKIGREILILDDLENMAKKILENLPQEIKSKIKIKNKFGVTYTFESMKQIENLYRKSGEIKIEYKGEEKV